jgi:SAM-dependent methyltransferase
MNPLDLYARIEPMIGFYEQYEKLYTIYLSHLKTLHVTSILDVGCGNGKFLKHLNAASFCAEGIDRSAQMVQRACELGMKASTKELDAFDENSFDGVVAVADVLNYIPPHEVNAFFGAIARVLRPKGYFLCDVNTLYGFENVAEGVMQQEEEGRFLCVEATYAQKELLTKITLFEQENELYRKLKGEITQYYHSLSMLKKTDALRLISTHPIALFSEEADKTLLIYQKR